HVMTDLVRDHIGLRELASLAADVATAEAGGDLIEEGGIEINLVVGRAVERPHGALRDAAAVGAGRAPVQHENRRPIVLAVLGEAALPPEFGAAEPATAEAAHVVLRCPGAAGAGRRPLLHLRLPPVQHLGAADEQAGIDAERPADEPEHDNRADADAPATDG